jgi:hypothetical protein
MTDQCFKKFTQLSKIVGQCSPTMLTYNGIWENHYGLNICPIPDSVWKNEPLLVKINSKFPILVGFVIKTMPNILYNWHLDGSRAASINLRFESSGHSHSLFGESDDGFNDKFVELEYEPNTFYLFNTQHKHCVINFNESRYVFSLQFVQTKDEVSYQEIYNWCNGEGLFE